MLACSHVTIWPGDSEAAALHEFSASFACGKLTALTGGNGSGKTSLALVLSGIVPRIIGGRWSGEIAFDEHLLTKNGWPADIVVSYAPAEAGVELLLGSVEELLSGCPQAIKDVAAALPLGDWRHGTRQLSAGQRRLMAWLLAAARHPRIMIVDEAFASLDSKTAEKIAAGIRGLPGAERVVMIATAPTPDQCVGCDETIALPRREFTPKTPDIAGIESSLADIRNIPTADSVTAWWSSEPQRKFHVSGLRIRPGEIIRIRGDIGAGKTTVLKAIGAFPGTKGDLALTTLRKEARPAYCGGDMYFTAIYETLGGLLDAYFRQDVRDHVWALLEGTLHPATLATDPAILSTGQRQLLSIVVVLLGGDSPIVCLDEPERTLDTGARAVVASVVAMRRRKNAAIVMATHDEGMIEEIGRAAQTTVRQSWVEAI